jgi:hypothetical protein
MDAKKNKYRFQMNNVVAIVDFQGYEIDNVHYVKEIGFVTLDGSMERIVLPAIPKGTFMRIRDTDEFRENNYINYSGERRFESNLHADNYFNRIFNIIASKVEQLHVLVPGEKPVIAIYCAKPYEDIFFKRFKLDRVELNCFDCPPPKELLNCGDYSKINRFFDNYICKYHYNNSKRKGKLDCALFKAFAYAVWLSEAKFKNHGKWQSLTTKWSQYQHSDVNTTYYRVQLENSISSDYKTTVHEIPQKITRKKNVRFQQSPHQSYERRPSLPTAEHDESYQPHSPQQPYEPHSPEQPYQQQSPLPTDENGPKEIPNINHKQLEDIGNDSVDKENFVIRDVAETNLDKARYNGKSWADECCSVEFN